MKSSTSLIGIGLLLVGCGTSSAPTSPNTASNTKAGKSSGSYDDPKSLFPMHEGNSWQYSIEVETQLVNRPKSVATAEMEYRISKVIKDGASTRAIVSVFQDGRKKDEQEWESDDKGIFMLSSKPSRIPFTPKQPIVLFPLTNSKEIKWEGNGNTPFGIQGHMNLVYKNDGVQDVDTDMGSMNAAYIQSSGPFTTKDGKKGFVGVNSWFSPGVGLVRYRQVLATNGGQSGLTIRLKSYTVKK